MNMREVRRPSSSTWNIRVSSFIDFIRYPSSTSTGNAERTFKTWELRSLSMPPHINLPALSTEYGDSACNGSVDTSIRTTLDRLSELHPVQHSEFTETGSSRDGTTSLVNEKQSQKQSLPMSTTESGTVIALRLVQFLKHDSPMYLTDVGIETVVSETQLSKHDLSNRVTVVDMPTSVSEQHP